MAPAPKTTTAKPSASDEEILLEERRNAAEAAFARIEFTPSGDIIDCNDNFCAAMGYSLDEVRGQHHRRFVEPSYGSSPEYANFWHDLAAGKSQSGDFMRFKKNGEVIWLKASYVPLRDASGTVERVVKFAQDITAQKIGEQKAQEIQSMVENAPVNILMANRDLIITYANPASIKTLQNIEHLLPIRASEIIGANIDIFHQNPASQRALLADPRNLPHQAKIKLGDETLDLLVSAIVDGSGTYIGPMVTWKIITDRVAIYDALKETSTTLSASAIELSNSSEQMAASATQTTAQSETVAVATEQADRNLQTVAQATGGMAESINEIAKNVQNANSITGNAVNMANSTNDTIVKLGDSSEQIGKVVKLITSIAQQTNLLALNATIEAARAGEAGKGFAVVANEVKELANKTATATDEISSQIESIQSDTKESVVAIKEISETINNINEITVSVASATEEQSSTVDKINKNVQEVATGTQEVARNIVGVSDAAKSSNELAASLQESAEGLAKLAADLQKLVDNFQI
jgi:methyl-accepting chemotaxis protein